MSSWVLAEVTPWMPWPSKCLGLWEHPWGGESARGREQGAVSSALQGGGLTGLPAQNVSVSSGMSHIRLPGCHHGAGTGHSPVHVHAGRAAQGGLQPHGQPLGLEAPSGAGSSQESPHPCPLPCGLGWSSCPQDTAGSCSGCDACGGQGAIWGMAPEGYPGDTREEEPQCRCPVKGVAVQSLASVLFSGMNPVGVARCDMWPPLHEAGWL